VPQYSNLSNQALESSTPIMDQERCVWRNRTLKSQVCCSNGQEIYLARDVCVFIAYTPKISHWKVSTQLVVKLQFNLQSNYHICNCYIQIFSRNEILLVFFGVSVATQHSIFISESIEVVLTRYFELISHKNKEFEQCGNYRWFKQKFNNS
jgi:hypothetical protein